MKTRIISAAAAIVIAVAVLCLHKTYVLNLAVAFLIAVALWELMNCAGLKSHKTLMAINVLFGISVPLVWEPLFYGAHRDILLEYVLPIECFVYILGLFCCLLAYYKTVRYGEFFFSAFETLFVTAAMSSILVIHDVDGLIAVILTLCAAWLADSGAYFAGTFFGKHKLCPNISPKKTVEGLIGGTLSNGIILCIVALVYSFIEKDAQINYILLFIVGCIAAVIGLIGDLAASLVKRQTNIKDYGNIMPGHGGVMDRFDSVLLVAPFMAIMFSLFDII